ncbi:MAG: M23 family metallopeptidase [Candidatus Binatia bacterium]
MAPLTRAFLSSLVVLSYANGCIPQSPPAFPKRSAGTYHVVQKGENLFRIGKAYDVPYAELAAINRIKDPGRIRMGQRIFVPGATRRLPVEVITPSETLLESGRDAIGDGKLGREFIWPVRGATVSGYGPRNGSFHDGIDISAPQGTPIRAVQEGEVIYSDQLRGYGNLIIIRHGDGLASVYSHNRKNLVREGQKVAQGEVIGEVGTTGRVSGPHLHFEVRRNNKARDPIHYLPRRMEMDCAAC